MYYVEYGTPDDKIELERLYNLCFPDDVEFSEWFFENVWDYKSTIVIRSNERIVSSLQMLPLQFTKEQTVINGCYIFAVCTDPEYRGKGYAARLIERSFEICKANEDDFCALIARESSLLQYYERFGFKSVLKVTEKNGAAMEGNIERLGFEDISDIDRIYKKSVTHTISPWRNYEYWHRQMSVYKVFGHRKNGKIDGYCFGDIRNDAFYCVEALGSDIDKLCSYAAFSQSVKRYKMLTLPTEDSISIGCIKVFSELAKRVFEDGGNGYLNLYFN